ncbi:phosphatidylserine decarboxylase [Shewanella sp. OPT22]|nr:phosphatidylserine decarboxylase [Shewanella sp. OPT22]
MKAGPLKNLFIKWYINHYKIDMEEAVRTEASEYVNFNDFFCRELKSNARPICEGDTTLAHPVDGKVSQLGDIEEGKIIQAKNHDYSVETLLGGNPADAKPFENGTFATVYLSPADYHRVHMPIDGKLKKMIYVSGDHFSVGPNTAEHISGLFARNERVVCIFDTDIGEMAMVLVGATIVSSIQPAWEHKPVTARRGEKVSVWEYNTDASDAHVYKKGDEMGHFKLGSTVVMCFEKGKVSGFAEGTQENSKTTMGTKFAYTANHVTADQSVLSFHES